MSVTRCGNCEHPVYRHAPDDLELCRIEGCRCPGLLTKSKSRPTELDRAIAMVRFAHHEHAFGDEDCTPANCSVAEFLAGHEATSEEKRPYDYETEGFGGT